MKWLVFWIALFVGGATAEDLQTIEVRSADGAKAMRVAVLAIDRAEETLTLRADNGAVLKTRFAAFLPEDGVRLEELYQRTVEPEYVTRAGVRYEPPPDPVLEGQIAKALDWLKTQQNADGSFGEKFPVAMSAFALLCYSGQNEGAGSALYGKQVRGAVNYLLENGEKKKGVLSTVMDRNISYEHGIATWALAAALAVDRELGGGDHGFVRVEQLLQKAVMIIIEGQTKGGGWLYSYGPNGTGDLSVSIWNLYALEAADEFVPADKKRDVMRKARDYLETAFDRDNGGYRYRCRDADKGKWSLTGHGLSGFRLIDHKPPHIEKSLLFLQTEKPDPDRLPLYSLLPQADELSHRGGAGWVRFKREWVAPIRKTQAADGSWTSKGGHASQIGADLQVYSTTLATLILQISQR